MGGEDGRSVGLFYCLILSGLQYRRPALFFLFPHYICFTLKGLSHEIDLKNVDDNGQTMALLLAAAGFLNFSEAPLIFS
jgi:hypothetical protein